MYLSKDESRLLAGYFTQIAEFRREVHFQLPDLCNWLKPSWLAWLTFRGHKKRIAEYWDDEELPRSRAKFNGTRDYINNSNRVRLANNLLAERRLITLIPHDSITDLFVVSLTLDGYDLDRGHSHFFDWSGLWFREYKDHWMWLIAAFFGGSFSGKIIDFMSC